MNKDFEKAFEMIIGHEGEYSNHPMDHGGPTIFGITHREISKFLGHEASIDEVKHFPLESAKAIYKTKYWDAIKLDSINSLLIKLLIFDQGVNCGPVSALIRMEKILGIKPNGVMDNETIFAINKRDEKELAYEFVKATQKNYINIVKKNATQIVFLSGWINRSLKLMDMIIYGIKV